MPRIKSIAELENELLDRLRQSRAQLAAQLKDVDSRIALLTGKPSPARAVVRRGKAAKAAMAGPKRRQVGGVPGKPLKDFLAEAMGKGGSMRARDLTEAVLEAGYPTKDRNFRQTVASALAGDKRFRRIRRGIYKLAASK